MNSKKLVLIAAAVGCSVVAMLGIRQAQTHQRFTSRAPFATTDIPSSTNSIDGNSQSIEIPVEPVSEDAVNVNSGEVTPGEIPAGMRLISIDVNAGNWIEQLRPGNRLDVLVTFQELKDDNVLRTRTRTLLEWVKVYAMTDQIVGEGELALGISAKIVHLLVTPEQIEYIRLAQSKGELYPVLRHYWCVEEIQLDHRIIEELEAAIAKDDANRESGDIGALAVRPTWSVEVSSDLGASRIEFALPEDPGSVDAQ